MKINVTQEDIDLGVRLSPESCPVANAIKRTHYKRDVSVSTVTISIGTVAWITPESVKEFINNFDLEIDQFDARKCKPFSFELKPLQRRG